LFSVVLSHDFAPAELSLPSLHPHSPMSDCFARSKWGILGSAGDAT
jgi:hypothetical protein